MVNLSLARAIVMTVAYTDQFGYPLSAEEIYTRLIGDSTTLAKISRKELLVTLQQLVTQRVLSHQRHWYALAGSERFFDLRAQRATISQRKWQEVAQCVRLLRWIPWLQAIFVTGSVAMQDAGAEDDVDFFIVASRRRLWLVRGLVIVVTSVFGKRRSWSHGEANSWCFNVWLDEDHLPVDVSQHGVYIAYEVMQARCVMDKKAIAEQFLARNQWVKDFLPQVVIPHEALIPHPHSVLPVGRLIFDVLDQVAYRLQLWYMKPHRTRERVGQGFAFFHPRDTKTLIMDHWKQSLKRLLR